MFLKRKSLIGEMSNVRFINGTVTLKNVKLNVCSFETDGVLIDTGSKSLLKEFSPFFAQADVDKVMITHFHEDHTGGAAFLQNEYKLPIYMNEMTIGECSQEADYPLYRQLFWGKRVPFQAEPIGNTFTSRNATWDVINTPGHAKDHLSFLNRETGQLFSGDLYVHPKTKVVLREENIPSIINSIENVLTYDFGELFCCHAGYVKDGRQALTRKLDYLKELQENICLLQKQGYNEHEIKEKVFKKKYPITFLSGGEWDSIHIIRSILNN
ncbi:MBL fold metallo-hydrolase [Virgibacillus profundi]|uniref:MBL fold metallo-hydrolase n=1 Tax=Virgibacillus profundi TaxID=2024555 RepID=A0A2A2IDI2_9BACI|nr:MBL fold metallo-hydrolase [Virgibacillus profundi]PAV29190.1 MBL fold metallo-hydrolase [Virgibacillus profundi]PXY53359.1 MBL fold metallo-hydrolase [Virgibacillus profundi]